MIPFIPLNSSASVPEVGNKAWALMELSKAFFPIAKGFIIPSAVYFDWKEKKHNKGRFTKLLQKPFQKMQNFYNLNYPLIARSSATVEDAPNRSWAGLFTSVLNIANFETLIDAILQIYQDLLNPKGRVSQYCKKFQISLEKIGMAVLIQEQIIPDTSGILFTRNPITGKDEYIIEYVHGPPWKLVSGKTDGNRVIIARKNEIHNEWVSLIKIGNEIEQFFNYPQDIEWAIKDDEIIILQARFITTLRIKEKFEKIIPQSTKEIILEGTAASLGTYQGKVIFIYDDITVEEAERIMKPGLIVITLVLFPEYFGVLSKAGAIIAQPNSINCHVAILSREMNIPCVVGINIKELSKYVREGDSILVNGTNGTIHIPYPKRIKIKNEVQKELWGFDKSDRYIRQQDVIDILIECTRKGNSSCLKKELVKANNLLYQIAPTDVDRAKSLYYDLSLFMQDIFVEILKENYSSEDILKAFTSIDSKYPPTNSIEKMYLVIKEFVNKHSSLRYEDKPFWSL